MRGRSCRTAVAWIVAHATLAAGTGLAQCTVYPLGKAFAPNPTATERFGVQAAVSEDTAVVSSIPISYVAPGLVHVLEPGGALEPWQVTATLTGLVHPAFPQNNFGSSLDIEDDRVIVGSLITGSNSIGVTSTVHVFERNAGGPGAWGEVQVIEASDPNVLSRYAASVALYRTTLAVGAHSHDGAATGSGAVYVYELAPPGSTGWVETQILFSPNAEVRGLFGGAVALEGNTLLVAAFAEDGSGPDSGAVHVFRRDASGSWSPVQRLVPDTSSVRPGFGVALRLQGDLAVVGARMDDELGTDAGAVYVFERANTWQLAEKLFSSQPSATALFGSSLWLDGELLAVGAPTEDFPIFHGGAAYLFQRNGVAAGFFGPVARVVPHDPATGAGFGVEVVLGGGTLMVGAPSDDELGFNAGALYSYEPLLPHPFPLFCTAGVSSKGCQARICVLGNPSASAGSGFALVASGVQGAQQGLFYYGTNGRQANPWGNGTSYQCVVPPVKRAGVGPGTGTTGQCDGFVAQDLNALWCATCPKPGHNPGAGATVQAQLWYTDPLNTSNQWSSLSEAIEFLVQP